MPTPRRTGRAIVALGTTAVFALVGCTNTRSAVNRRPNGGSATASVVAGEQRITVNTGDTYRFDPATITVHPGRVTVVLVNNGHGAPHNWTLIGLPGAATALANAGQSQSTTFTAPAPGSYSVVCTIHEKQGQTGTLVVLAN